MARPKTHSERMIILERIIGLVKEQGRITTNDVVAMFGVHRTTAEKYLQIALVRGGFTRYARGRSFARTSVPAPSAKNRPEKLAKPRNVRRNPFSAPLRKNNAPPGASGKPRLSR